MDELIDKAAEVTKELGEIGREVLQTGASLVGPAVIVGMVYVGFKTMFKGFKD